MKLINALTIVTLTYSLGLAVGCKKSPQTPSSPPVSPPTVITKSATNINSTSVVSGGELLNATNITDRGVIWGTDSNNLTVSSINKISNGAGVSDFTDTVQNLLPNTIYYLRAYAIYSSGVAYGATIQFTTLPPQPNVYVAGYHGSSAAYWKNGKLVTLTNGTYAHSIFVVGNDVYVAGDDNPSSGQQRAVYWKNGIQVPLTDGTKSARALSIFVAGNDVHVAGYEVLTTNSIVPIAKYWKNGVAVSLVNPASYSGIANSIYVVGNDVYVTGWMALQSGYRYATYWKNGTAIPLSNSLTGIGTTEGIFVLGNDVYSAGNESPGFDIGSVPVAKYWKNGTAVSLTNGNQFANAYSVYVTGSDVYVAGYDTQASTGFAVAKYWKNGIPFSLTDGTEHGNAQSIYVSGNDVYVAGSVDNMFSYRKARYWKNGVSIPLEITTSYSTAVSVFVQ